ncbi:hypothetical protein L195_g023871, partial [Trifolium pratense]
MKKLIKKLVGAIEAEEDEEIDQKGLVEIEPYRNEFNPSTAVRFLTKSIKSKFDCFCPTWGDSTEDIKKLWFKEFKKYCTWERKYDARIRHIFYIKGEARFRGGSISMGEHTRRMSLGLIVELRRL